ncbi:amidohydrolase family protein [Humisphaera borealis]|uniref:Amidohydrolase family protein n=1 Tax=Humisphaera borealis TaxID=2807512 RepID=A0A7M2WT57_9BACT|nr:amidohydrolase family protein [Humisphaera borealis]QOV88646.1 amidohydrolase family protein [Humisphaera borealis]
MSLIAVLVATLGIAISNASGNDQIPGKPLPGPLLLHGGDIHTVSGDVILGGWVLIENGKIADLGKDAPPKLPEGGRAIDIKGKRVYPGLIAIGNELGLVEIPSVRASRDASEAGQLNANVRAERGVNPDSELIPVTRANGVLLNLTTPSGGLVTGTSVLLQLDGWTWEDMTLKAPVGMHIAWPRMSQARRGAAAGEEEDKVSRRGDQLRELEALFDEARAYAAGRTVASGPTTRPAGPRAPAPAGFDARLEAMVPVVKGDLPIFVWADELRQIESAVAFAAKQKVKLVIVGGYDADRCADLLKRNNVAVVVSGTQRVPQRRDADYDEAYALPARLHKAGVTYCISYSGRFASNVRNLPYHAGQAVAFGLPADEAVRSITLHAATILGVADRVGSIEKGKDATLIVTSGDVLETPTQVELAFIQGRPVDLTSRHTRLWKKYQEKYK